MKLRPATKQERHKLLLFPFKAYVVLAPIIAITFNSVFGPQGKVHHSIHLEIAHLYAPIAYIHLGCLAALLLGAVVLRDRRERRTAIAFAAIGLALAVLLILPMLAGTGKTRGFGGTASQQSLQARRAEREHEWIQTAAQRLHQAQAPLPHLGLGTNALAWVTPSYLIFTNGWAAYVVHSMHAEDGIGDVALLRGSNGEVYLSAFHFCTGITDDFRDSLHYPEIPRPKDLEEFLEKYATSWRRYGGS